jgi:hypothetical protein
MIKPRLKPRIIAQQDTKGGARYFCDRGTFIDCVGTEDGAWYYVLGPSIETTLPSDKYEFIHTALDELYNWLNTKDLYV